MRLIVGRGEVHALRRPKDVGRVADVEHDESRVAPRVVADRRGLDGGDDLERSNQ
jgi:hypothetical protein